jgi:hypothetical protein
MSTIQTLDDRVWLIWEWCAGVYLQHGIKMNFPKHTDPKKTYQWRYLEKIATKFDEWEFDDQTARKFIDIAVKNSKSAGTLRKGLAALHQKNMLEICYKELGSDTDSNNQWIDSLSRSRAWVLKQTKGKDPVAIMLKRPSRGSFTNLTIWHQSNKVSSLYISLSKTCYRALAKLKSIDEHERKLLPSQAEIYCCRNEFLQDSDNLKKSKTILSDDWRNICL